MSKYIGWLAMNDNAAFGKQITDILSNAIYRILLMLKILCLKYY